jgi:hypothetical protein
MLNLGLHLNLGVYGGVLLPPNLDEAIQWLQSNDGSPIEILTAPTVDEPVYNDVPVLAFDGVSSSVTLPTSIVDTSSAIDISLRVLFLDDILGSVIISQGSFEGSWGIKRETTGQFIALIRPTGGSFQQVLSTTVPVKNTWYKVRMTWDSISDLKIYVNDTLEGTTTLANSGIFDAVDVTIGDGSRALAGLQAETLST